RHFLVVGEYGAGRTDLGAHIIDGAFAGGAEAVGAFAEIFYDSAGSAFYGEDAGDFEDDVFRGGPAAEFTGEFYADEFGHLEFPGEAGHNVNCVCAAYADGDHSEASGVGGMGVGTDHHASG